MDAIVFSGMGRRRLDRLPLDHARSDLNCSGSEVAREAKSGSDCVSRPGNDGVAGRYSPGS